MARASSHWTPPFGPLGGAASPHRALTALAPVMLLFAADHAWGAYVLGVRQWEQLAAYLSA